MTAIPPDLDAVLADVRAAIAVPRRMPWWRRRAVALVLLPAALGIGAAAYALSRSTAEQVAGDIACHNRPSLRSSVTGIVESDGRDPTVVCAAELWRGRTAPPLVACANTGRDGEVEVFPSGSDAICERLGLVPLPPSYREAARRFAAFRTDVGAVFLGGCVTEAEGRRILRAALERHGLQGWSIETIGFSAARPCATLWFDTAHAVAGMTGGPGER
jgi:hypothetical protein